MLKTIADMKEETITNHTNTQFTRFLKDNDALENYENALDLDSDYFRERIMFTDAKYYLISVFPWGITKQGTEYWKELNDKWQEELKGEK